MEGLVKKDDTTLLYAKGFIDNTLEDVAIIDKAFFRIGFRLNEAVACGYVAALGYSDIEELAEAELGFKSTTTKNLMAISRTYYDGLTPSMYIADKYKQYNQTQLVEMLNLEERERENIPPTMKIAELRDYKKIVKACEKWSLDYIHAIKNPTEAVEKYRKDKEFYSVSQLTDGKKKYLAPTFNIQSSDVAPGQIAIGEEYFSSEEFQKEDSAYDTFTEEAPCSSVSKFPPLDITDDAVVEVVEDVHCVQTLPNFKNRDEVEAYIVNSENYMTNVVWCPEIGVTIRRMDFRNGAKLYLTEMMEKEVDSKTLKKVFYPYTTYNLVDICERRPNSRYMSTIKKYTRTPTPLSYIIDYILTFKDEL